MHKPVTYYFSRAISGTVREGERTVSWSIKEVTFDVLTGDQAPPSADLVLNCHRALRDKDGEPADAVTLSFLDLEQGLRDAFKKEFGAAWETVKAA